MATGTLPPLSDAMPTCVVGPRLPSFATLILTGYTSDDQAAPPVAFMMPNGGKRSLAGRNAQCRRLLTSVSPSL